MRLPERRRHESLGRARRSQEVNIEICTREIRFEIMEWIRLDQDTVQWRCFVSITAYGLHETSNFITR